MAQLVCKARAKVNLTLDILGRRPDGYHDIESVMHTLELGDIVGVNITSRPEVELKLVGGIEAPEGPENLAFKAAAAMRDHLRQQGHKMDWGVEIELVKRIPSEAGLAGGSSDAAAVLALMDEALGNPLGEGRLLELAGRLGADIPFLLQGGMALAKETGGELSPLQGLKGYHVALAKPNEGLSTGLMYRSWDEANASTAVNAQKKETSSARFLKALSAEGPHAALKCLHNDFEDMAIGKLPSIGRIKRTMLEAGAISAMMTGSGTAVFGIFEAEPGARKAIDAIGSEFKGIFTMITRLDGDRGLPMLK